MTRQHSNAGHSPELLAAQERLLALRKAYSQQKSGADGQAAQSQHGRSTPQANKQPKQDLAKLIQQLPPHLGWENTAVTKAVRKSSPTVGQDYILSISTPPTDPAPAVPEPVEGLASSSIVHRRSSFSDCDCESDRDENWENEVRLHPAVGLGMLRDQKAASGRVWLLLRLIDNKGQGWVELEAARKHLASQNSSLHICGPRQFRNLLIQGEGIFWEKRDQRLWLRSVPKVAAALGVQRLDGRPIALPRTILTQSIGKVRAHLYAAFHSGRKKANPISRAALTRISEVSPRTQQNYERRAGVRKQRNFATGARLSSDSAQEQAWQKGPACFPWHDHKGTHGSTTATFLAWQLPNSYNGPHEQRPHGNRKRFNRQLADLSTKGMTGNGRPAVEFKAKRYCDNAKAAAQSANNTGNTIYWRGNRPGSWYLIDKLSELK